MPVYPVVTAAQMRALEAAAEVAGWPSAVLMERAGLAVAETLVRARGGIAGRTVLVLAGPGNNGGDGLVAARHLVRWGGRLHVYAWRRRRNDPYMAEAHERGATVIEEGDDPDLLGLRALLSGADMVIDALLGTGTSRPVEGRLADLIAALAERRAGGGLFTLALDLPTGVDSDSGAVSGAVVDADLTVTLGAPKRGLFEAPGRAHCGRIEVADIGLPAAAAADYPTRLLDAGHVASLLPRRPLVANKGTFGKVLVVGGAAAYVGAPRMAAAAALRGGAGLVTLAVPASLQPVLAGAVAETTFLPLPETTGGALGPEASAPLAAALPDYDALVIGCGLGRDAATGAFLRAALEAAAGQSDLRVLVDADGLNLLAAAPDWNDWAPRAMVLTPHPGEMGRLLGRPTSEVLGERESLVRVSSARTGQVLVLKGAHTLVGAPDGAVLVSPFALPALATAGTGDVLAGLAGAFLAQGLGAAEAAACGVYVHALAGELVAPGPSGLVATDLLAAIPRAMADLRGALP
jgi:NAD(P)H-hydrate epimerase